MPSSDIDQFATGVELNDRNGAHLPQGVIVSKRTVTVAASTSSGDKIGMVRFYDGFTPTKIVVDSADLDTGTDVTLDVGYIYDSSTLTDDEDYFFDGIDIAQDAGSVVWPVADGLNVTGATMEGDGYINITTGGGATTTEGDITIVVEGTYGANV